MPAFDRATIEWAAARSDGSGMAPLVPVEWWARPMYMRLAYKGWMRHGTLATALAATTPARHDAATGSLFHRLQRLHERRKARPR